MTLDARRLLAAYYGPGTLIFWGLDIVLSAPIRASFLGRPTWRVAYYLGLLGLGALCRWRPGAAPAIGLVESSVNFLLVLLSILLPVWGMADQVLGGAGGTGGAASAGGAGVLTSWTIMNALLSGTVFVLAFHKSRAALERQLARGREDGP